MKPFTFVRIIAMLCALTFYSVAFGTPRIIANGRTWFLVLLEDDLDGSEEPVAQLYRIDEETPGKFNVDYTIKNFDADVPEITFSPNGNWIVRSHEVRVAPVNGTSAGNQPVFDMYANGKLLKRHLLKDIFPDFQKFNVTTVMERPNINHEIFVYDSGRPPRCEESREVLSRLRAEVKVQNFGKFISEDAMIRLITESDKAAMGGAEKYCCFVFTTANRERLIFSMNDGLLITRWPIPKNAKD